MEAIRRFLERMRPGKPAPGRESMAEQAASVAAPVATPEAGAPLDFKIDRSPNRHIAFGQGRHSCIGGPLVRMEMAAAFGALARAFPHVQSLEEKPEWTPRLGHRWLARLRVGTGL